MAKKKKHASILDYIEEKKSKRIDPAQLTIVKEKSNADKLVEQMNAIEGNIKTPEKFKVPKNLKHKEMSMVMNPAIELNPEEKKGFFKRHFSHSVDCYVKIDHQKPRNGHQRLPLLIYIRHVILNQW